MDWSGALDEKDLKYIRGRLKSAREDRGLSQSDVADAFGVSQTSISNLELGRVQLTLDDLVGYCRITGKPLSYFLPSHLISRSELSSDEQTLISLFREIEDQGLRDVVLSFVKEQVSIYKKALELSKLSAISQQEKVFRMLDSLFKDFDFEVAEDGSIKVLSGDVEVSLSFTEQISKDDLKAYLLWRNSGKSSS